MFVSAQELFTGVWKIPQIRRAQLVMSIVLSVKIIQTQTVDLVYRRASSSPRILVLVISVRTGVLSAAEPKTTAPDVRPRPTSSHRFQDIVPSNAPSATMVHWTSRISSHTPSVKSVTKPA